MKKLLFPLILLNTFCFAFGSMPDGPWRDKCSNNDLKKSFSAGVMTAFCGPGFKDFFGGTSVTLNYNEECQSNSLVDYVDGQLICLSPKPNSTSNLPGGTWLNSCNSSKATFKGGVLKAFCNKSAYTSGVNATLDYASNCKPNSLVKFSNGELMCDVGGNNSGGFNPTPNQTNNTDNLPSGSWISSCDVRGATMRGTILITDCKNSRGEYISTALDLKSCTSNAQVSNSNGNLTCSSSQGFNPNPNNNSNSQGFNPSPNNNANDELPSGNWRNYCNVSTATLSDLNVFEAKCKQSAFKGYFTKWFNYGECVVGSGVNYDTKREEFSCVEKKKW
ncbi:MAG: hypothetical protein PHC75_04490 [Burkholderiales bacterium]|nr:hypothetical protein [Burkholderiales bacterium]